MKKTFKDHIASEHQELNYQKLIRGVVSLRAELFCVETPVMYSTSTNFGDYEFDVVKSGDKFFIGSQFKAYRTGNTIDFLPRGETYAYPEMEIFPEGFESFCIGLLENVPEGLEAPLNLLG